MKITLPLDNFNFNGEQLEIDLEFTDIVLAMVNAAKESGESFYDVLACINDACSEDDEFPEHAKDFANDHSE